jgi:DNA-binding MarR family transcriptional regulator
MSKSRRQAGSKPAAKLGVAAERRVKQLEVAFALFNEINIVAQLSANLLERSMSNGLTLSQFSVLNWFVRVDRVATPGRLARAFQVSKGAMTNTLTRLEQKGFVTVEGDPDSKRRKLVRATRAGVAARDVAIASVFPELERFLDRFGVRVLREQLPALREIRGYLDLQRESTPAVAGKRRST